MGKLKDVTSSVKALEGLTGSAEKLLTEMHGIASDCEKALEAKNIVCAEGVLPTFFNLKVLSIKVERMVSSIKDEIGLLERRLIMQRLDELIPCATLPRLHDESKTNND